jgi:hypothetical protein
MRASCAESTLRFEDVFTIRSSAQTSFAVATDIVEQGTII